MNLSDILAAIGLVVTIVLGLPALLAWFQNIPSQVFYVDWSTSNLFTINNGDVDDIEIIFRGKKVDENLYLIKAFFLYQGKRDIDGDEAKKPIYVDLPKDSNIYSLNVIKHSKDLEVIAEIKDNRLIFSIDILKNNDYFLFESLVEVKVDNLDELATPGHRIVDVDPIEKIKPFGYDSLKYVSVLLLPLGFLMLIPAMILFYTTFMMHSTILDFKSKDINTNYYMNGEGINADSLRAIYVYRSDELYELAEKVKDFKNLDTTKLLEIRDFVNDLDMYNDMVSKTESVFYKFVPKQYPLHSLLTHTTTKLYPVNKKFGVTFSINVSKLLISCIMLTVLGLIFFTTGLILFVKWYGKRRVRRQVDLVLREIATIT